MPSPTLLARTHRWAIALAPVAVPALVTSPAAEAAGPRPMFQMPFACGQTWEASTYSSHWPDQDSIDLGQWTAADANMSQGEPVLATADGTVLKVFTDDAGGNRVYLDHGDGWVTHYLHLEQLPPLTKGQAVAQGEQSAVSATAAPSSSTCTTPSSPTARPSGSRSTARSSTRTPATRRRTTRGATARSSRA